MLNMVTALVLAGGFLSLVSASIYPTQPIQVTVWSTGQPVLATWVDDGTYPTLNAMGPCEIQLFRDTDTWLASLALNVDPKAKSQQVTVPENVLNNGSKYTLRFVATEPYNMIVYSADFTINPANTTNIATPTSSGVQSNGTSPVNTSSIGLPPGSSNKSSQPTSVVIPPQHSADAGTQQQQQQPGLQQGKKNAGRRIDIEKFKFRLVFIIWPVLMGITMAL
ncbi:hypothetical protein HYDPIDRAFT_30576 [Hydnomerulius pinastri MD-312]|uniref:Yeast cell wall synthesis Kre9/Knh1-like N-terminal domain-containing protein n=1 Tax=Hydnomerulius pinastri MD-312 TaxID=994086 RepID=A0A0C9WCP1_9AGAM|nr:hypothetical protein HYDPIDRAFT_30576 [Hydnomerulius pinastri MD-312]